MKYLTITKARASFLRLVDNLAERTAIVRNGQPVAVLLDFDDYRALCAAQALARDPARLAEIQAAARRVRAGDLNGFPEMSEAAPPRLEVEISTNAEMQDAAGRDRAGDLDDFAGFADAAEDQKGVEERPQSLELTVIEQLAEAQAHIAQVHDRLKRELMKYRTATAHENATTDRPAPLPARRTTSGG